MIEPSANLFVLVLEDEPIVALVVEDMLNELGYEHVQTVSDIETALTILAEANPALAILDVNIAGKPTFKVADALSARRVPFVFATGYGRGTITSGYGSAPILQKPFLLEDLRAALARLDPVDPPAR